MLFKANVDRQFSILLGRNEIKEFRLPQVNALILAIVSFLALSVFLLILTMN